MFKAFSFIKSLLRSSNKYLSISICHKCRKIKMLKEEKVIAKMLLYTLNYGMGVISKYDDDFKEQLRDVNKTICWKIGDDIKFYTVIKNMEINGDIGDAPTDPDIIIKLRDHRTCIDAFFDIRKGLAFDVLDLAEGITISGDINAASKLTFILSYAGQYLEDIAL